MKQVVFTRSSLLATASMMLAAATSSAAPIGHDTIVTFDSSPVLSTGQQAGAWYVDRYAPAAFESVDFEGDNRLRLAIDGEQGSVGRGTSYAATFYNTHGRKLDLPTGTYAVEAKVHVPASWLDSGARRRSDLWATGFTAAGAVSSYPIIGFANVDGTPVLRAYNTITGDWIVIPGAPEADTWYTVGIQLEGGKVVYTLNGAEVASCPAPTTTGLGNVIVQAYNFNDPALAAIQQSSESYDAHWDDLSHSAARVSIGATTYASIQAAVDAAVEGDVIEVGAGVYDGSVLINKDGITIQAAAGAISKPRLQVSGDTAALGTVQFAPGADNITIQGLEIVGLNGPAASEKAAIYFQGAHAGISLLGNTVTANGDSALLTEYGAANTGFTISNNLFNGATFTGTAGGASNLSANPNQWEINNWPRPAFYMGSSATLSHFNITITGNEFATITGDATNGNGLLLVDGGNVNISNNTFSGTSGARPGSELVRVRGTNSDVTGNTFSGSASIAVNVGGTANDTPATSEVTGNVFTGVFTAKVVNASAGVLNATLNFWGDTSRPTTGEDFVGNLAALPYFKDAARSVQGPVRVNGTGYATIQGAINAVSTVAGNTVEVDAGTYAENVTLNKDLDVVGAGSALTTVSASGSVFAITAAGTGASVSGLATTGGARGFNLDGVDNIVLEDVLSTGNSASGVNFSGANSGITLRDSSFSNNTSTGIKVASAARVSNFTIDNTKVDGNNFGLYSADGNATTYQANAQLNGITVNNGSTFSNNAGKGIYIESMNDGLFEDITVSNSGIGTTGNTGSGIDINLKYANYSNLTIRNSVVSNCGTNYSFGGGILVKARNDGSYAANPATLTGTVLLEGLRIENCGGAGNGAGIRVGDAVANVSPSNVVIRESAFSGSNGYAVLNLITGATVQASHNHWASASGPVGVSTNGVGGAVNFNPWYATSAAGTPPTLSDLRTGLLEDEEVDTGDETIPDLYIAPGVDITVPPTGTLNVTNLELAEGGTLNVNGGSLTIGSSTITGTFMIFNSFGSFNINDDTTFSVNQSLALVSDIHVAAGKTITVNGGGELILDGCVIDSQTEGSSFNITTATNGLLTMARNVVTDAVITVNTDDTLIAGDVLSQVYDNRFVDSTVGGSSTTARVYHNILEGTSTSSLSTLVDGWANVTDASGLKNLFTLDFDAPASSDRTLIDGNLFVQSGDDVVMALNVGDLDEEIISAEALLGFSSGLLGVASPQSVSDAVVPEAGWQLLDNSGVTTGGLGLVDSAIGLDFSTVGGSAADARIAKVTFEALAEGITTGFFRVQTNRIPSPSNPLKDTRLTTEDLGYLSPFTANAGELIIDDQAPVVSVASAIATQGQPSVSPAVANYLNGSANIVRGSVPVSLSFTAEDAGLAGIDTRDEAGAIPTDLSLASDLLIEAKSGANSLVLSNLAVSGGPTGEVTFTVDLAVPATTPVGVYTVTAKVLDRSGNDSGVTTLGTLEIANEARVKVEIHGFQAASREVVFVATGGTQKTWTKTVAFTDTDPTSGVKMVGEVVLDDVPAGTTAISAKSAWTNRKKLATTFSAEGYGETNFLEVTLPSVADNRLKGGDLNGDNVINTLDYGVLRSLFNSTTNPTADIDGNGVVNITDFNILQSNFYKIGDAQ